MTAPATPRLPDLLQRYAPVLETVAAGVLRRDREHEHPVQEVRALQQLGFGALRVPEAEGGAGASLEDVFALLLRIAAADSNLPQIWRNHLAFVEDQLLAPDGARWRAELVAGRFVGGAWSEVGGDSLLALRTTLTPRADGEPGWTLTGSKYYATGSLFADRISVLASSGPDELVLAVVPADAPGVRLDDDWRGIGQRLTASGTAVFQDVPVAPADVYPFTRRVPYQEALYQLVHVATLGGIARAAHRDAVVALRERRRAYPAGLATVPREDPQYHEVLGRVGALASSIEASVLWAARALDGVHAFLRDGAEGEALDVPLHEATVAVYEAQLTATDQALEAATLIYDVLGSSALDQATGLDRHWRNARTVTSHNPRVVKARIVGDWHVNGTDPIAALWRGPEARS